MTPGVLERRSLERMRTLIFVAIIILSSLIAVSGAKPADIFIDNKEPISINIRGKIERGDYDKIITLVKKHGSIPGYILINSPGGDVIEAMKIGRFARKALLAFWASRECNSSCVLIYFATIRDLIDPWFSFGIHRPYFDKSYFSGLSAKEAELKYKDMENTVRQYLEDMNVPRLLVDKIFSIPSNEVEKVSEANLADIIGRNPPAYEEWILSRCGDLSNAERKDLLEIETNQRNTHSPGYIKYLKDKRDSIRDCEVKAREQVRKEVFRTL
jgi:hypothetical protein